MLLPNGTELWVSGLKCHLFPLSTCHVLGHLFAPLDCAVLCFLVHGLQAQDGAWGPVDVFSISSEFQETENPIPALSSFRTEIQHIT